MRVNTEGHCCLLQKVVVLTGPLARTASERASERGTAREVVGHALRVKILVPSPILGPERLKSCLDP